MCGDIVPVLILLLLSYCPAEPLHEVVAGKAHLTLTLTNPMVDCSLTDTGDNFRLVQYVQESRLLGILTGRHTAAAKAGAVQPGPSSSQHGAAAAKTQSHPIEVSESVAADEDTSAAGPAGAGTGTEASAGSSAATAQHKATAAAVAADGSKGAQAKGTAAPALPANFIERLAQADATSHVSAELHLPMLSVYVPDGELLMPKELA